MSCSDPHHCITCGDDGLEMTVLAVDPVRGLALCAGPDGERRSVETALVEPVTTGDRLLVHAGTAIAAVAVAAPGGGSVAVAAPGGGSVAVAAPGGGSVAVAMPTGASVAAAERGAGA